MHPWALPFLSLADDVAPLSTMPHTSASSKTTLGMRVQWPSPGFSTTSAAAFVSSSELLLLIVTMEQCHKKQNLIEPIAFWLSLPISQLLHHTHTRTYTHKHTHSLFSLFSCMCSPPLDCFGHGLAACRKTLLGTMALSQLQTPLAQTLRSHTLCV